MTTTKICSTYYDLIKYENIEATKIVLIFICISYLNCIQIGARTFLLTGIAYHLATNLHTYQFDAEVLWGFHRYMGRKLSKCVGEGIIYNLIPNFMILHLNLQK